MLPRIGTSKFVSTWILVTLAASVISFLSGGWFASWTALEPSAIWHGQVWRLGTWALVEVGVYGLAMTIVSLYKFGGELAPRWGDRRLRQFALHLVLVAGVVTTIGALVSTPAWHMSRCGGSAIGEALCIAWARQYPTAQLRLYGVITLSGQQLIYAVAGYVVLTAIAYGPFVMAPELVCCLGAAFYPRSWLSR